MSHSQVLEQAGLEVETPTSSQKRRIVNAMWQPFLQFKLLMYMLGTTALVAVLLGAFLYFAFSDLIGVFTGKTEATDYYGEMIEIQLIHLFRYCGALFVLYILLLAAVCVAYTHRLIGPLRPFTRHVEALTEGNFSSRVTLRKGDLELYNDYAEKLNELAANLEKTAASGQNAKPAETEKPEKSDEPAEVITDSTEVADSTEVPDSTESAEVAEAPEVADSTEAAEAPEMTDSTEAAEAPEVADSTEAAEAADSTESAEITDSPEATDSPELTDTSKSAESASGNADQPASGPSN